MTSEINTRVKYSPACPATVANGRIINNRRFSSNKPNWKAIPLYTENHNGGQVLKLRDETMNPIRSIKKLIPPLGVLPPTPKTPSNV